MSLAHITLMLHTLVALTIIVGYIVLDVLGHDGTPLLAVLAGQGVGGAIQATAQQVTAKEGT